MAINPTLYQINTRVWLNRLARESGGTVTLDHIPDSELDRLASLGFDWIYFLSIWQIGEIGPKVSRSNPNWLAECREHLPDFEECDIAGSGFAITSYTLNSTLGEMEVLIRLRDRLHKRGLKLMLDFVPNHTAIDHPWVQSHPEYYISGNESLLSEQPQNYIKLENGIFAYGRDPYFDGWCDTLQLNYGNPELQKALIDELLQISQWCDGLRCDMAMLVLPEIFQRTWGIEIAPFWQQAIAQVKASHPDFIFMAEVYWDMEWTLQQLGFDYTYDKRLYDRLLEQHSQPVRSHFWAALDYQQKSARFLENHDEPRAATSFPIGIHQAAAIISYCSPGLRFFHEGQMQGWLKKISVHLHRSPAQSNNSVLQEFYQRLLQVLQLELFRNGEWQLLECKSAWEGNWTWDCFIAFAWQDQNSKRAVVVVNYAPNQSQCYVQLPWSNLGKFSDLLGSESSEGTYTAGDRSINNNEKELYYDLPAWGFSIMDSE
jgi:glycosidase